MGRVQTKDIFSNYWLQEPQSKNDTNNTSGSQENLLEELELLASECIKEEEFLDSAATFGINPYSIHISQDIPQQKELHDDDYYSAFEKERFEIELAVEKKLEKTNIRWQKGSEIGHGSFGSVYLGLNLDNGELMAVKQVYLEGASNKIEVKALQQEIMLLQTLQHTNIVQYLGSSVDESYLNIFLEYIPGGSIASIITKFGCFNENLTRVYTKQILNGLEYLHSRHIIHRDIKGANILVDNRGIIKLSDFGASKQLEELFSQSGCKSLHGTVYWMAPEVIKQAGYGRQADIWSLGCTVLEMATGKPPWVDEYKNQVSALYNIALKNESPPIPDTLTRHAKDFLRNCLKINPKERPNANQLLNHPWINSSIHSVEPEQSFVDSRESNANLLELPSQNSLVQDREDLLPSSPNFSLINDS